MMILFPLTFLSNAFVPVRTLPGLATFVNINPVSHLVSATRDLANGRRVISRQVGWTLLAGLVVIAVFAPLSVRSYKRHL